ncbi:MAG: cyclodeaminase/cyclohydrolase family protein [Clostridia bacterium]|nr:cyclodeaminase/cyclohydrolase family protein [Clostridia bacterium]
MKLVDMTVTEYLNILESDAPAPGGGSVSALSSTQACDLVSMVCGLTIGREKYAEYEEVCKEVQKEVKALGAELYAGIDKDTDAFNKVAAAYKMPKDTDELKAARSAAIRAANVGATQVPYDTVRLSLEGLRAMKKMAGQFNQNAASDFGVAALSFLTGARGAWLNVKINLPGVKDEALQAQFAKAEDMVAEAEALAKELYEGVRDSL